MRSRLRLSEEEHASEDETDREREGREEGRRDLQGSMGGWRRRRRRREVG